MEETGNETGNSLEALSDSLAGAVERVSGAVVSISGRHRIPSSGVIWSEGAVVTAAHTLKRNEEINVTLPDNRTVTASVAGRDASTDLAVLKLEGVQLKPADRGDTAGLKVGQVVLAVARGERGVSASMGVISTLSGKWRTWRGGEIDRFVGLDLALYPGFSGGPLVDARGRILGINTSGLSRNIGLVIPAPTVDRVAGELLRQGRIAQGYLGVGLHPVRLPESLRASLNLPGKGGLVVLSVEPNGPAHDAGMLLGDVLIGFDGESIHSIDDVQRVLGPEQVGKAVSVSLVRGGAPAEIQITVGERPRGER
jgi:serine protease Do